MAEFHTFFFPLLLNLLISLNLYKINNPLYAMQCDEVG